MITMQKQTKQPVPYDHAMKMLQVMPPAMWYEDEEEEVFQVGECYQHDDKGFPLYQTYERNKGNSQWYYSGTKTKIHPNHGKILMESYECI